MPVVRVGRGVGATQLHYDREGSGEPVLWITGFAISSEIFTDGLASYAAHYDCIRYDNRGAGRSHAYWRPTSMAELAGDAVALLDALGIDSAHVYGLSMGGMVAQEMAIRFPDRVRGLVLGATTPGGPRAVWPSPAAAVAMASRSTSARGRAQLVAGALFSPEFRAARPERVHSALALLGRHRAGLRGINAHSWSSFFQDSYARLPRISAPTLVLHGGADTLTPVGNARILAARIPDATLHVLPGSGHLYLHEAPDESFRVFLEWLRHRSPVPAGPPLTGLAAGTEQLSRLLGLPVGAWRTGCSLATVAAAYAAGVSGPASGGSRRTHADSFPRS